MAVILNSFAKGFAKTVFQGLKTEGANAAFGTKSGFKRRSKAAPPQWVTDDGVPLPLNMPLRGGIYKGTSAKEIGQIKRYRAKRLGRRYSRYSYGGRANQYIPHAGGRSRIGGGLRFGGNVGSGGFLGEVKNIDFGKALTAIPATGAMTGGEMGPDSTHAFNGVAEGTSAITRVGREIRMLSLVIKGTVVMAAQVNQTAQDTAPTVTIVVVIDTQCNGVRPNSEDYYTNGLATDILAPQAFRNLNFGKRFLTLKTLKMTLRNPPSTWDGTNMEIAGSHRDFTLGINLKGRKQFYTSNLSTYAAMPAGAIEMFAFCSNSGYTPQLTYNSRLSFVDT